VGGGNGRKGWGWERGVKKEKGGCLEKSLLDLRMLEQLIPPEVLNQVAVGAARAAPGHGVVGLERGEGVVDGGVVSDGAEGG
jgi:hypothetical protein